METAIVDIYTAHAWRVNKLTTLIDGIMGLETDIWRQIYSKV